MRIPLTKNQAGPKRIGIDARFYGPAGKGLGRYTQEVVDNILKIDKKNKYIIFLTSNNFDELKAPSSANVEKVMIDVRWYSLAEQIIMPFYIFKHKVDLVHFPHFNVPVLAPAKFVVTIHDLILTKFPTPRASTLNPYLYKIKNLCYKVVIWTAIRRAKRIIAVSEFTKNDIIKQFRAPSSKIKVTYEGVANLAKGRDSLFVAKLDDSKTLLRYNIKKDFFLYVGNAYPHKNLETLIQTFKNFHKDHPEVQLVLVGRKDYFYQRTKKIAAKAGLWDENSRNNTIVFPDYVPDEKLEILYKQSIAYIFPSLYEGFGLPPLEAMAKGCPVLSSNAASMPEVLGEAALYFNPRDPQQIIKRMKDIKNNKQLRKNLTKKGYKQVKKYSWWECGRETLEVYAEIFAPKI